MADWKVVREYQFDQKIHTTGLRTAANNPDLFAVALMNGTVVVCDTATGRARFAPITPPARVASLNRKRQGDNQAWIPNFALSPDGRWLRTINDSWAIFDAVIGEEHSAGELFHLTADFDPVLTPFSPDGKRMVTSSSASATLSANGTVATNTTTIELRSVPDGKVIGTFPPDPQIYTGFGQGIMFSADGKRLLILGYLAGSARTAPPAAFVRETETLAVIGSPIPYPSGRGGQFWLTPDGTRVVIASNDRAISVYLVDTGKLAFPPLLHGGPASCAGMSDDSTILATVSVDGLCRLWNLKTGALAAESTYKQDRPSVAALSPDGRTLLVSSASGLVHRLQLTRGAAAPLLLPRTTAPVSLVQFAAQPPTRLLWFEPREAKALEIASGRWVRGGFSYPETDGGIAAPIRRSYANTLRPGDKLIVRSTENSPTRAWTMGESGVAHDVAFADSIAPGGLVLSVTGKYSAAVLTRVAPGETGSVRIWDLETGKRVATIAGVTFQTANNSAVDVLTNFSPDDRRIAISTPQGIQVYEIKGEKLLFKITADEKAAFRAARFSADGTRLLTGNAWGKVQVWDGMTGNLLQSHQAHGFIVTRFDFSDDGRLFASGSQDGTVQMWDSATYQPVGEPLVHSGAATRVSFSSDGRRVLTAANDGLARVWDVQSGIPISGPLDHHRGNVHSDYSPDGRFLLTYSGFGTPTVGNRVWAAPPAGRAGRAPKWLLQLATICAGRRLTDEVKFVSAADEFDRLDELRRELAELPADDPYGEWARWFLSDSPTRSIAPGFTVTPAEAKKLADELSAPDPFIAMLARDAALLLEKKYSETEPLEREMLAHVIKREGTGGYGHGDTLVRLAQTLVMVGKFVEAESVGRAGLAVREKFYSVDASANSTIYSVHATIGSALVGQKRYAEAEPLLVDACARFKQRNIVDPLAPAVMLQFRNRISSLVELYEATGRPEKAAEWKAVAAALKP